MFSSTDRLVIPAIHETLLAAFRGRSGASQTALTHVELDPINFPSTEAIVFRPTTTALPSEEEMLVDPELFAAVATVGLMSERVFAGHAGTPELTVDNDPVLGGIHLTVEVPISDMDPTSYSAARKAFDEAIALTLSSAALRRLVIFTRLDA